MLKIVHLFLLIALIASMVQGRDKILTLDQIIEMAREFNPELRAVSREIEAREGALLQASLRPNPEIEVESESGPETERTALLQQTILTAGKRRKRMDVAALQRDKAQLNYQVKMLEVMQGVKIAFIEVLADHRTIALLKQQVAFAQEFLAAAKKKVEAGGISPAETARARVFLANSRLELLNEERILESDLQQLASFWGGNRLDFDTVTGTLDTPLVSFEKVVLESYVQRAPIVILADSEIQIRESTFTLEKANQIPNISFRGGIKQVDQAGSFPAISLSVPLPIFNRNQGAISEAAARQMQALDVKEFVETQVATAVHTLAVRLQRAYEEAITIRGQIIPEAENAYRTIQNGYSLGRFSYLELMDAQTTLFDAESAMLAALGEYHRATAELEGLLGESLKSIVENSTRGE